MLTLVALAAGAGAALLFANLVPGRQAAIRRRLDLASEAQRVRSDYEQRLQRELEAFEAEFDDIDILFDS